MNLDFNTISMLMNMLGSKKPSPMSPKTTKCKSPFMEQNGIGNKVSFEEKKQNSKSPLDLLAGGDMSSVFKMLSGDSGSILSAFLKNKPNNSCEQKFGDSVVCNDDCKTNADRTDCKQDEPCNEETQKEKPIENIFQPILFAGYPALCALYSLLKRFN